MTTEAIELNEKTEAAAPAPRAITLADILAQQLPNVPTAVELEQLRTAAEASRTAASQAADRVKRLRAEIEAASTTAQPRPDLAQAMADLTAKEIEARVKGLSLPKGHAERVAEARAAIAAHEAKRIEAELTLPALASLRAEIAAEATRTDNAATRVCGTYGTAAMLHMISTRYFPALAVALEIEAELEQVSETWGGNVNFQIQFLLPIGGDRWSRRELLREIQLQAGQ